jgi:hypothetical protein
LRLSQGHLLGDLDSKRSHPVRWIRDAHAHEDTDQGAEQHHTQPPHGVRRLGSTETPGSVDKVRVAGDERSDQGRQFAWVELTVGIHGGDHNGTAVASEAVAQLQRPSLTQIDGEPADQGALGSGPLFGAVGRAVIDQDHLGGQSADPVGNRAHHLANRRRLVKGCNDHGDRRSRAARVRFGESAPGLNGDVVGSRDVPNCSSMRRASASEHGMVTLLLVRRPVGSTDPMNDGAS